MSNGDDAGRFRAWIDRMLDPEAEPGELREIGQEWCRWGLEVLGVDALASDSARPGFSSDTRLPSGKAISPLGAARCIWEYRRTAVFLRALEAAVQEAFRRFPGEPIQVMEVGCGPLAPLAFSLLVRYPAERVRVGVMDLHPDALEGVQTLAARLGLSDRLQACIAADATTYVFSDEERPHIIVAEVLLRALTSEPQVAVTMHLAPQLRPGGLFLPQCIDVHACLFDSGAYFRPRPGACDLAVVRQESIAELGRVFRLDARNAAHLEPLGPGRLRAGSLVVPPHSPRQQLKLFTRIEVFPGHELGDFDSSLNLPAPLKHPPEWREQGGRAEFFYEISEKPGLRLGP